MRRGDLSGFSNRIVDPLNNTPFPNNIVPAARISPVSTALISMFYPQANYGNTAAFAASNYRIQIPLHGRSDDIFGRMDYRVNNKHSIFASYGFRRIALRRGTLLRRTFSEHGVPHRLSARSECGSLRSL